MCLAVYEFPSFLAWKTRALSLSTPLFSPDFIVTQETLVGLSATQFWEKYYADEAEFGFDKFMQSRGEKNALSLWKHILTPLLK